ncbi:MAG: hypothetical protein AVDCRST_MAG55-941 [uncultured Rubrobacteraceae bacterium]|uniref:Uncharacterized protein n=1 Tax=uncultured Rubrobacteraceae bacterium TaxID=349277 RepID=A0A6J4P6L0_9ACTN|nr:MAG: hypothetical protein AVDCRST_MAG55-941 [uncultured Rubrobacteraceae bacterium]
MAGQEPLSGDEVAKAQGFESPLHERAPRPGVAIAGDQTQNG